MFIFRLSLHRITDVTMFLTMFLTFVSILMNVSRDYYTANVSAYIKQALKIIL